MSERPVMIVAGGTGGHVFPALAVAQHLAARGVPVVWLGTPGGLEARVVPEAGIRFLAVSVKGLRGNGLHGWLAAPWMVARAFFECRGIIRRQQPRVMLGMGGYVTGPAGLAARVQGCPLVIHEQNAIPGLTNRLLARRATRTLTGLDARLPGRTAATFVGNPVRSAIRRLPGPRERYTGRSGPLRLLVVGGSLGALQLNRTVPQALARLPLGQRPEVVHQAGSRTLEVAREAYAEVGIKATVQPFVDDMAKAYAESDLVICRAGALTVSELAVAGVPAILVPYPHAVDDHQRANARFLTAVGGARMLAVEAFDATTLAAELEALSGDRETLIAMAEDARARSRPEATEQVADACLEVAA